MVDAIRTSKSNVQVDDEDVRQAYEESLLEVEARHILVEPVRGEDDTIDWEATRAAAEELRDRIVAGEDFAAVAKEKSADPGSAEAGGSLGWVTKDAPFVPEFKDALFALEGDKLSEPVRSQFGYHLIQVTDRRVNEGEPFDEVKEELRSQIAQERGLEQFQNWLTSEREQAEVAILDAQLRANQLLQSGRLDQAIAGYREAIAQRPNDAYLHYRLALALEQVDAHDEALASFKSAAEIGTADPQLWFALGEAYKERGRNDEARDAYLQASELSPTNLTVHLILQQVFEEMGYDDLVEAEEAKIAEIRALLEEQERQRQAQMELQQQLQERLEEARRNEADGAAEPGAESGDGEGAAESESVTEESPDAAGAGGE